MMKPRHILPTGLAALALLVLSFGPALLDGTATAAEPPRRPIVVELYTSQGCNTCPPADALLGELAQRNDLLPLSFHVDYWDYICWKDRFALPGNTERQRGYARELNARFIYTPQMVVDGRIDAPGHRQRLVYGALDSAARDLPAVPVTIDRKASLVRIGAGDAPLEGATVWLVVFDRQHSSDIARGENAGQTLSYFNVVRDFRKIGSWTGAALEIPLDLAAASGNDSCAVLLQTGENGPMLGAARMDLRDGES